MFADWTSRWENLITEQKSRMYVVQPEDGSLTEAVVKQENLNSVSVVLIVDIVARAIWIWHGKDVGPKDKFVGARAARALRSVVGPKFRTMSPIGEGEETSEFSKVFESAGGVPEEPSSPPVQLEDVPDENFTPLVQLEDVPDENFTPLVQPKKVVEESSAPPVQLNEITPPAEEIKEVISNVQTDTSVQPVTNTIESKSEEPSKVTLPSIDPEKVRDLASLIISYTLRQIYRVEPITSRTKAHDLFRVSQEGVQLCKLKTQTQNTAINVLEAIFDEKEEEESFFEELTDYLEMLQKISLSR